MLELRASHREICSDWLLSHLLRRIFAMLRSENLLLRFARMLFQTHFESGGIVVASLTLIGGAFWVGALWSDHNRSRLERSKLDRGNTGANKACGVNEQEEGCADPPGSLGGLPIFDVSLERQLSQLGKKLQDGGGLPAYVQAHISRLGPGCAYSDETQMGHIGLAIAENTVVIPLLRNLAQGSLRAS